MKVVNVKNSKYDEYIGRGSVLGNPFVIGKDGTREEVIAKYRDYIWNCLRVTRELEMLTAVEFEDCVLGCHCAPKKCHGDVVVDAVNYLRKERSSCEKGEVIIKCPKCNSEKLKVVVSGPHKKLVCSDCFAFVKFLSKADHKIFVELSKS